MQKDLSKTKDIVIDLKFINLLAMLLYVAFFFCTFLNYYLDGIILLSLFVIWFVTAIFIDFSWINKSPIFILSMIAYMLLIVIDWLVSGYKADVESLIKSHIYSYIFMIMGLFYVYNSKKFNFKYVLYAIFILMLISYIATIVGLQKYPTASRDLASGINPLCDHFKKIGIGGFAFIYQTPIIIASCILIINNIKLQQKILLLLFVLIMIFTVYQSDYTTALITVFISIMLIIYFKSGKNTLLKFIILGIVSIVVYLLRVQILEFIVNNVIKEDNIIRMRLIEFLKSMTSDDVEFNRFELMKESLEAFVKNPIIGEIGLAEKSVGGHSDLVDTLGKYGIIGFILYNVMFLNLMWKNFKTYKNIKFKIGYAIICFIFIFTRLNNSIIGAQNISGAMFLVSSIILLNFNKIENNIDNSNFTEVGKDE